MPIKKSHIRYASKILLLNYAILQLAKKSHSDKKYSYIQTNLKKNQQLIAKMDFWELKNKELLETLKAEEKKRNKDKKLNFLGEKDNGLQLF